MSFRRLAESRIRDAMEQGVFDNLPGAGKPLDLEEYFNTPEEWRVAFSILKNARCAPLEVELLKEVSRLEQEVAASTDAAATHHLQRALAHRRMHLAVSLERRRLKR